MEGSCSPLLDILVEGYGGERGPGPDPKLSFLLRDHAYGCVAERGPGTWSPGGAQGSNDSNPEDLLQLLIHPSDVYDPQSPEASPESNSRVSEDPCADTPLPSAPGAPRFSPTVIYEVICDTGFVREADQLFSSPLENWPPLTVLHDACATNEVLPGPSENGTHAVEIPRVEDSSEQLHLTGAYLTEEERRLLSQEGVLLHSGLPLTKAEERILKKVRRKIRNKQSAQDSRRRKKEYIDGLESRAAACSAQNQELRRKVHDLEVHHVSLLDQLQRLQHLLRGTSTKAVQTSSCLLILVFSLGFFILPSCTSLLGGPQIHREGYQPAGVLSRNILNQGGLSDPEEPRLAPDDPARPGVQTEPRQEDPAGEDPSVAGGRPPANASGPGSPETSRAELREGGTARPADPKPDGDPAKQTHADEM